MSDRELFEAYRRDIYRLCLSMLRSRTDAEDICQDTFVRAFKQNREKIDPVKPWLIRIAVNLCRTHLKRTGNGKRKERQLFRMWRMQLASGADEEVVRKEAGSELDELLRGLPERLREVLVLRYVGELSLPEIADVMEIPLGTVKSRLHKGHGKVKALLENGDKYYAFKGVEYVD